MLMTLSIFAFKIVPLTEISMQMGPRTDVCQFAP